MNTSQIKIYAPKARTDFIKAVTQRAARFGIHSDKAIEEIQFTGDVAIIGGKAVSKQEGESREKLVSQIKSLGFETFIQSHAYRWFNRFIAIRYMELHGFLDHGFRVLSNPNGSDTPEILEHAADAELLDLLKLDKEKIIELKLAGNRDNELYRIILLAQCNSLNKSMPFLFERIDNEAELLLPDNLLQTDSPIKKLAAQIDEELWNDVEIIGWIYQFYISEKKDEVIGKVVKSEDIPAATQLFTPNWIVKYMVQNTLGRMWLAAYPDSSLKEKMEYYINPSEQDAEVQQAVDEIAPKSLNPEDITFLDPACGSGHILVEAYDLLKEIYLEQGYRTRDIPRLILEKNLYGIDIDDRAAQLAGFALLMRARNDDRRLFSRDDLQLNIISIVETKGFDKLNILDSAARQNVNQDVLESIKELIELFEHGKTFGSLITIPDKATQNISEIKSLLESDQPLSKNIFHQKDDAQLEYLKPVVRQAEILSRKYDCVVANPPYMGTKGMNQVLKDFAKKHFPDSKSDIFAMFSENIMSMTEKSGCIGLVMPYVWMFLSSYESFRNKVISKTTLTSLIQLEYNAFEPACVPVATFTLFNQSIPQYKGNFIKLSDFKGHQNQAPKTLEAIKNPDCGWLFNASAADFKKIPGSPIAYWVSQKLINVFLNSAIGELLTFKQGIATSDNERFLRYWHEISYAKIDFICNTPEELKVSLNKWFPYNKGGAFRKWYGNNDFLVNWENDGEEMKIFTSQLPQGTHVRLKSRDYYCLPCITYSSLSSSTFGCRISSPGFLFDTKGSCIFAEKNELIIYAGLLNSNPAKLLLEILYPTLDYNIIGIKQIPSPNDNKLLNKNVINNCLELSIADWNSYETSWDFAILPLLQPEYHQPTLKDTYKKLREHWQNMTLEMQRLEEENNRIFIDAYGLQDELTPDVPLEEITLTCNPRYRYSGKKSDEELEALLLADTLKELISYAVGCMMGRYSLDEAGLVYAESQNQGFDHSKYKTFPADDDGIVPIMDMDWFEDDAAKRFVEFIKTAWTQEKLNENLKFIADILNPKSNESPENIIRQYFSSSFFKDHLRTYKKRPIYWLFSSGKQKAFEALVYLHRYNESTLARMRANYVTPLQGNINARIEFMEHEKNSSAAASSQRKIQKEIDTLKKKQLELKAFDDELRHFADMKISLDLDDGVKVNYSRFGNLVAEKKAVAGDK